jgi:hypothetical protein
MGEAQGVLTASSSERLVHLVLRSAPSSTTCGLPIDPANGNLEIWLASDEDTLPGPVSCKKCLRGATQLVLSTRPPRMSFITVFQHPHDYPRQIVARRFYVEGSKVVSSDLVATGHTLRDVQLTLTDLGLVRRSRSHDDLPQVLEVWT